MSRHTHYVTLEFTRSTLEVAVDFDADPGEPRVMTLPNGDPGYPGCPPSAELIEATVYDWTVDGESRERGPDRSLVWDSLDKFAEAHLEAEWHDKHGIECLESIEEPEPDGY